MGAVFRAVAVHALHSDPVRLEILDVIRYHRPPSLTGRVPSIQAFFAAREAVGDIAGMCERKPDVCVTGRLALSTITVRARESARYAMEMLEDEPAADAPADVASSDHITTGTVAPQAD